MYNVASRVIAGARLSPRMRLKILLTSCVAWLRFCMREWVWRVVRETVKYLSIYLHTCATKCCWGRSQATRSLVCSIALRCTALYSIVQYML